MHPELIGLYNEELQHLRRETDEFAAECGSAAAMLALDKSHVPDPYVERLIEGVAYLAARVRLKLDSQYPVFTQQLLDVLFPGWLAPSPPACVFRLAPDLKDPKLLAGPTVPRGHRVRGDSRSQAGVHCEFEIGRDLRLWPLVVRAVTYSASSPAISPPGAPARSASTLRIELELALGADLSTLQIAALPFFVDLKKQAETGLLMELLLGRCQGVSVSGAGDEGLQWLDDEDVRHLGFGSEEALFPIPLRAQAGARVLREYAAFPEKFNFFELARLDTVLPSLKGRTLVLTFHFQAAEKRLEGVVRAESVALHCVPAVNLCSRHLLPIQVDPGQVEFLVNANSGTARREVVKVERVTAGKTGFERVFAPVFDYASKGPFNTSSYYALRRQRRSARADERASADKRGSSTALADESGPSERTDLFISLSERGAGPHGADVRTLAVTALCMDREAAASLHGGAEYSTQDLLPLKSIGCVAGPSEPLDYPNSGALPWQALSQLYVNHLSLRGSKPTEGADALRAMLHLYAPSRAHFLAGEARALREVHTEQITRRLPRRGELAFGRGIGVRVKIDKSVLGGGSPFMLGAMLDHYLASHVAINSFAELTLEMSDSPQPLTWRRAPGVRPGY